MRDLACVIGVLSLVGLSTSCIHRGPELAQPVGETHTTASSTGGGRPRGTDGPNASVGVVIGEDVRRACGVAPERQARPIFDVDSARLHPQGEDILAKVAACLLSGKLQEPLRVIGHTDPRGEEPYNQQLGLYRAISAKQYLVDLGVPASKIDTESHGARDSKGTDEVSWALDRTIEVRIAVGPGDIPPAEMPKSDIPR